MKASNTLPHQPGWLIDGLIILAIWLLCFIFVLPAFAPGQVMLPLDIIVEGMPPWQESGQVVDLQNPLLEDAVYYIFPVKQWTAEIVRNGELPLWNPMVFTGYPAIYDTQAGLFYPFSLLYYTLPATTAVDLTILLQMMAGVLFMYLYLRRIQLHRVAATIGSILFIFNGLMIVWLEWQVVHAAIIWLPLILYFIERAVDAIDQQGNPLANAAAAGAILAVPWLGGHWNWTLYISMTVGAYLLWRLWTLWQEKRKMMFNIIAVTVSVGIGISLIQVLPAFRFLSQSHRQSLTWHDIQEFGLLNRLVVLTIPDFFGNPQLENWWGVDNFNETTLYMGIAAMLLAAIGIWHRRNRLMAFWTIWGSFGLLLTLGAPFYGILYILPVFNGLLPSRAAVLVVVSTAVLAAMGVDALLAASFRPRSGWVLIGATGSLVGLTAVYLFIYRTQLTTTLFSPPIFTFLLFLAASSIVIGLQLTGKLSTRWFVILILVLIISDLFYFGYDYNTVSSVEYLYPPTPTDTFLQNEPQPLRIVTQAQGVAYRPNTALVPRIPNLSGYGPGIPARLTAYINLAEGNNAIRFKRVLMPQSGINSPLLDALGVTHVVTIEDLWGDEAILSNNTPQVAWMPLTDVPRQSQLLVGAAGLQRIDVALRVRDPGAGHVMMRIFTIDGGQELAHAELAETTIAQESLTSFYFGVFPPEWGDNFVMELTYTGNGKIEVGETAVSEMAYAAYVLPRPLIVHEAGKTRVYQRENNLGRAYAVPSAIRADDQEEAISLLAKYADSLDQIVVLETEQLPFASTQISKTDDIGQVKITYYGHNEISMEAEMAEAGYVILTDLFYPGWQASVAGESVPIYRANLISRAVAVPVGTHTIQFVYRPFEFYVGALISGLVLLGVVVFWMRVWRQQAK